MKSHIRRRRSTPLNALRAFESAARLGRGTAAADELGVTHGAVSRQIAHLEDVLSVDLWTGPRSRPELTDAGRQLALVLTDAFDRIDHAVRSVTGAADGRLHIACLSSFAVRFLIPRLHRFDEKQAGIDIQISTSNLETRNRNAHCDLVITVIDSVTEKRAADVILLRERIGVVMAPRQIKQQPPRRLISRTRPDAWAQWLACGGTLDGLRVSKAVREFDHYHFAIQAASSGLGVCVAPWHLVADDVKAGGLVAPAPFVQTGYCYVLRPSRTLARGAGRFVEWLRAELEHLEKEVQTPSHAGR